MGRFSPLGRFAPLVCFAPLGRFVCAPIDYDSIEGQAPVVRVLLCYFQSDSSEFAALVRNINKYCRVLQGPTAYT